jgi:hypothetical protein
MTLKEIWERALLEDPTGRVDPMLAHPIRRSSWVDPNMAVVLVPGMTLVIGPLNEEGRVQLGVVGAPRKPISKHMSFAMPWGVTYEDMVATDWEAS